MMECLPRVVGCEVDWMERYANEPQLQVVVDHGVARRDRMKFEVRKDHQGRTVRGQLGDLICFNHLSDDNQNGYGGSTFTWHMVDGSILEWKGPWSSNPSWVNSVFPDRDAAIEVYSAGIDNVSIASVLRWLIQHPAANFRLAVVNTYRHRILPVHYENGRAWPKQGEIISVLTDNVPALPFD